MATLKTSVKSVHLGVHRGNEDDDNLKLLAVFKNAKLPSNTPSAELKDFISLQTTKSAIPKSEIEGEGGALFVNTNSSVNDDGPAQAQQHETAKAESSKKGSTKEEVQYENRLVRISKKRSIRLSGSVDLTQLPSMLVNLDLAKMTLTGPVDLTSLPHTLQYLNLSNNGFTGTVNLKSLPAQLAEVHLEENRFHGILDISRLPMSMESLFVQGNMFDWLGVELSEEEKLTAPNIDSEHQVGGSTALVEAETAAVAPQDEVSTTEKTSPAKSGSDPMESSGNKIEPATTWVGAMDAPTSPGSQVFTQRRIPIQPFHFSQLPFKLKILNITNNRFKNKFDAKTGVRTSTIVFTD